MLLAWALPLLFARTPFTTADFSQVRFATDPRISADAAHIVYVETRPDRYSNLRLATPDGKTDSALTEGNWHDWSPRWSPDGSRIAWLSDRSGRTRLRIRPLAGGAEVELPTGPETPVAFSWSAEGNAIAYTALRPAAAPPAWLPAELASFWQKPDPASAVFTVPVAGGEPRRISGEIGGCRGEPAWLLDSKSLATACDAGIYLFPGGKLLTRDPGRYESPVLSSDGGRIAYLFTPRKPQSYTVRQLLVMNVDGSRVKVLSGSLDRDATDPQWSSESRTVYFLADDRGSTHVYAAHNDGRIRQVTSAPELLRGFSLADNGRAVSIRSTPSAAGDVYSYTVDVESEPVTVAAPNAHLLADRDLASPEELPAVHAWLIKPPAFDPARKYPLLLDVADDPRRMVGPEFDLRSQVLAAAGFVVLRVNPRGTPGYGEDYGNLLRTRYPGDDFDDLMHAVDAAIAKGSVDPQHLHIAGGLLATWAIGHTTRFRSAIVRHPITDWTLDVATAPDGARRAAEWMGAMPWDDPDQYVKHSPIYAAANFKTPVLILAAPHDPESDELAFALRQRKAETTLLRLPDSEAQELEAILAWCKR